MKKFISLILAVVLACGFCAVSFADNTNFTSNISATEIDPRRAEPMEVPIGRYYCLDDDGSVYSHFVYRTYLVPAGKTLICIKDMELQWTKSDYELNGRIWSTVWYYESTYQIV